MTFQRSLDKSAAFHFLDEAVQEFGRFRAAAFRYAHGLSNHHETFGQQA